MKATTYNLVTLHCAVSNYTVSNALPVGHTSASPALQKWRERKSQLRHLTTPSSTRYRAAPDMDPICIAHARVLVSITLHYGIYFIMRLLMLRGPETLSVCHVQQVTFHEIGLIGSLCACLPGTQLTRGSLTLQWVWF